MRLVACAVLAVVAVAAPARPPAAWVTVNGRVVFPPDAPLPMPKLLPGGAADESVLINPANRGVRNVVVWLRPDNNDVKSKLPADAFHPADARRRSRAWTVTFTPRGTFEPRIVTARVGDALAFQNLSPLPCNLFWTSANNGNAQPPIPPGGVFLLPNPLAAETAPIMYKSLVAPAGVGCVRIFDHPYHAVTDADGKFDLRDVPLGKFRLVYWHENKGFRGGKDGRFGEPVEVARDTAELPPVAFDVR